MKTILFVFGTRPEAIKMAPLIKAFQKCNKSFNSVVCVTAQHRQMLDQVLDFFEIKPDYDLNIMKPGQDLFDITTGILTGLRGVLELVSPDYVFVHGDTSTSTAAALAAFYKKITVCHVEAGLRTNDRYNPWPEEINRQITCRLATYHFAPTQNSHDNLLHENISRSNILVSGNTVIDALYYVLSKIEENPSIEVSIVEDLVQLGLPKDRILEWSEDRRMILITAHRRESFGAGFINICNAIRTIAEKYPLVDFVYPVHLNPNVRGPVNEILLSDPQIPNIYIIEPLGYFQFVLLMNKSYFILTDSGGIQEEAPSLGKPVLVLRNTTERPEAVEMGTVELIGTDVDIIIDRMTVLLDNENYHLSMSTKPNPYGDGKACQRIVSFIEALHK